MRGCAERTYSSRSTARDLPNKRHLAVVLEDRCADAARVDLSAHDRHLALRDRHLEAEGRAVILRDHFRSLGAEMLQHMNESGCCLMTAQPSSTATIGFATFDGNGPQPAVAMGSEVISMPPFIL